MRELLDDRGRPTRDQFRSHFDVVGLLMRERRKAQIRPRPDVRVRRGFVVLPPHIVYEFVELHTDVFRRFSQEEVGRPDHGVRGCVGGVVQIAEEDDALLPRISEVRGCAWSVLPCAWQEQFGGDIEHTCGRDLCPVLDVAEVVDGGYREPDGNRGNMLRVRDMQDHCATYAIESAGGNQSGKSHVQSLTVWACGPAPRSVGRRVALVRALPLARPRWLSSTSSPPQVAK